ncbi:hypothetical protein D3C76_1265130 [compost metagenome]
MPAADGPMMPSASPGDRLKLIPRRMVDTPPGAAVMACSTASRPWGLGSDMASFRAGKSCSSLDRRSQEPRAESNCFHTPMACSTGAMARPLRMELAIIIPAVISPLMASRAPAPRINDCRVTRTKRLAPLM